MSAHEPLEKSVQSLSLPADTLTRTGGAIEKSKLRVLFVEDNDFVRDLTVCLLEGADREVVAFGSAEDAYREFTHNPFDLVITDVSLPKMSGIELTKRLIAISPDTWFVIASGYQLPADVEKLGQHVRVMTKPFESEKIEVVFAEMRAVQDAAAR